MYCENPYGLDFESDFGEFANQFSYNSSEFLGDCGSGSMPVKQSLALDGEKGELVKDSGRMGKKVGGSETKTLAALKSHSEAERRRRERINAHFVTLRDLVPNNEKMDKAALLAEVINQVKQLKETATQASEDLQIIPMDTDEVKVEILNKNGSFLVRASLCCDFRPDVLSDLRQAMDKLPIQVLKSEISTLGSRVKTVFLITAPEGTDGNFAIRENIVISVRAALSNILEKVSASTEYAQQLFFPRKRQRVSYL